MRKIITMIVVILLTCTSGMPDTITYAREEVNIPLPSSTRAMATESTVPRVIGLKVTRTTSTALKLTWKKGSGASGYAIYKWNAKSQKYKIAKTLSGGSKLSWTDEKLKSNVSYKYRVRAFKMTRGKKNYGAYSMAVVARAFTAKAGIVNVKSIKVNYSARYLGMRRTKKIQASVVVPTGKKALSSTLTWESSNPSIVKVSKNGSLQAQGKAGKAKVVIRAHNGIAKTLAVTVADYARPAKFSKLDKVKSWNDSASAILKKYRKEMSDIASYLEKYRVTIHFIYEDNTLHVEYGSINFDPIEKDLETLLSATKMRVMYEKGELYFSIPVDRKNEFGAVILYSDYNGKDFVRDGNIRIAPCWYFMDGRNDLD